MNRRDFFKFAGACIFVPSLLRNNEQIRNLKVFWCPELKQDIYSWSSYEVNERLRKHYELQNEMISAVAQEMANEINREIDLEICAELGLKELPR